MIKYINQNRTSGSMVIDIPTPKQFSIPAPKKAIPGVPKSGTQYQETGNQIQVQLPSWTASEISEKQEQIKAYLEPLKTKELLKNREFLSGNRNMSSYTNTPLDDTLSLASSMYTQLETLDGVDDEYQNTFKFAVMLNFKPLVKHITESKNNYKKLAVEKRLSKYGSNEQENNDKIFDENTWNEDRFKVVENYMRKGLPRTEIVNPNTKEKQTIKQAIYSDVIEMTSRYLAGDVDTGIERNFQNLRDNLPELSEILGIPQIDSYN